MSQNPSKQGRVVSAVHGRREVAPDPSFETELSRHLREKYSPEALVEQYTRFAHGHGELDTLMRRAIWRVCRPYRSMICARHGAAPRVAIRPPRSVVIS